MLRVGFIGWRGVVGSVLMQRMREEGDFAGLECVFFSTSNAGGQAPPEGGKNASLKNASDLKALADCQVLISCQGGDYTTKFTATYARAAGRDIGLTQPPRCVWRMIR